MTDLELTRRAIVLLSAGMDKPAPWLDMEAEVSTAIPNALQEMAIEVSKHRDRRALLSQDYTVNLSSGVGAVLQATGSITSAADILWSSIPSGDIVDTSTNQRLTYVPGLREFEGYQYPGLLYYTLSNQSIFTRSGLTGNYFDSDRYDVMGPLRMTAVWIPTSATVPAYLETFAVETLARVVMRKISEEE